MKIGVLWSPEQYPHCDLLRVSLGERTTRQFERSKGCLGINGGYDNAVEVCSDRSRGCKAVWKSSKEGWRWTVKTNKRPGVFGRAETTYNIRGLQRYDKCIDCEDVWKGSKESERVARLVRNDKRGRMKKDLDIMTMLCCK